LAEGSHKRPSSSKIFVGTAVPRKPTYFLKRYVDLEFVQSILHPEDKMFAAWLRAYAVAVISLSLSPPPAEASTLTPKPVQSFDNVISRSHVFDHTFLELHTFLCELHDLEKR
jgi:hypothetical protein